MPSPYQGLTADQLRTKTDELIAAHPLKRQEIVEAVLVSWESIFESKIGRHGISIGKDIFPVPQIMGSFLHELIPLEIAAKHKDEWCRTDQPMKRIWFTFQIHFIQLRLKPRLTKAKSMPIGVMRRESLMQRKIRTDII